MATIFRSKISLYLAVIFYLAGGINHFLSPDFYLKIMPAFLPYPELLNILAGIAEIVLAIGLIFAQTRKVFTNLIIAMLLIFYIVHISHLFNPPQPLPYSVYIFRIFLQVFFIYWIWQVGKIKSRQIN